MRFVTGVAHAITSCHHRKLSIWQAFLYCTILSIVFVGGLYFLVPVRVRSLARDDVIHVKWRASAVVVISFAALFSYPMLFCIEEGSSNHSVFQVLGLVADPLATPRVLLHVMTLYLGPLSALLMKANLLRTHQIRGGQARKRERNKEISYTAALYSVFFGDLSRMFNQSERWVAIRNLVVAPVSEELVFRGCMVPVLLATGLNAVAVAWIAPLFFGTAHAHHAVLRLREGMKPIMVILLTTFQFAYTSLFGAYCAHAFIRTGSIMAVIGAHFFCNVMGLPDFGFLNQAGSFLSCLYPSRKIIILMYVLGLALFIIGFSSNTLFPRVNILSVSVMG